MSLFTPMTRRVVPAGLVLLALAAVARSADGLPVMPLGFHATPSAAPTCPLYWHPGEPAGVFPHGAASETAPPAAARGWLEVGQPERALELVGAAPSDPASRLYRLGALAALERWPALATALAETPRSALPAGCEPLVERWSAMAAAGRGDGTAAARALDRLADAAPQLGAWIAVFRLEAAALAGDVARGEAAWGAIGNGPLPALARADAQVLLPALYARGGRLALARQWELTLAGATRGAARAAHWLAAAELADRAGDRAAADQLRRRVLAEEPAAAAPLVRDPAVRARLRASALASARALRAAGDPAAAEPWATAALEAETAAAPLQEATLLRAEIRAARGDRSGADRDYAAFLNRWPNDPRAPETVMDRARLAMTAGDGDAARQHLDHFLARFPRDPQADDALYLLADSHQDDRARGSGNAERALAAFDRLVRTRPDSRFADRAYLRAAHLLYSLGRYAEAGQRYAAYRGGESAREARYWAARTAEARGERDRARDAYRALAGGSDYYALRARGRLAGRGPAAGLTADGYAPIPGRTDRGTGSVLLGTAAGRTAAALLALGERRYAHAELARALPRGDRVQLAAWAPALAAWGFPDLTLQIGTRLAGASAGEQAAFPLGFSVALDGEARAHALDAAIVLALIRQESLFDAEAVSPVGAHGLMQIMPATGREIADSLGWRGAIEPAMWFEPALSLHFGSRYLADQLARFGGFWPAVLAGYNGGPHNVARWMTFPERGQDAELWIDRIPYRETRNYVKHVYEQAAAYRRIYGSAADAR